MLQIYFHSVLLDGINTQYDSCGGEIEIEKVPVQMVEARAKGLVPVFDYLQTPKCQFRRCVRLYKNLCDDGLYD